MKEKFNEMPWHDAELLGIVIDRQEPGENDQVIVDVCWQNGEKTRLVFIDCYGLEARMNFGVIAPESILDASSIEESQELDEIRKKWNKLGVDLGQLRCFEIRTNSTDSILRIYALRYSQQPA